MPSPDQSPKGTGFITSALAAPVSQTEAALRPLSFADFAGQPKTVERLQVMVGAARRRGEALNHILLSGPPGLGKTTLAFILGHELGRNVRVTSGPVIEKAGDLAGLLTSMEEGDILFIDEIHRIPKTVEEYLYSAMEDFRLDIMIDQGPNARSVRLSIVGVPSGQVPGSMRSIPGCAAHVHVTATRASTSGRPQIRHVPGFSDMTVV